MSDIMIKKGDNGDLVVELQGYLTTLGFYRAKVDGLFGKKTDSAVRAFQKAKGLKVDGIVGPKTIAALGDALKVVPGAEQPSAPVAVPPSRFDASGWDSEAIRWPVHEGRIGAVIDPIGAVVHTTDMLPASFRGLLKAWRDKKGEGNAATYLIGREPNTAASGEVPNGGLVQLAPITRNANHAGGRSRQHGWLVEGKQQVAHPNSVYIGIEIHAAGRLQKGATKGIAQGAVFEPSEIYVHTDGTWWHRVTEFQLATLGKLLDALDEVCRPVPDGWTIAPHGDYKRNGVAWAPLGLVRFTTHVELDPIRKSDPGPQVTAWLRERYGVVQ